MFCSLNEIAPIHSTSSADPSLLSSDEEVQQTNINSLIEATTPDAGGTSSGVFSISVLIKNANLEDLMQSYLQPNVHDAIYCQIQDFLCDTGKSRQRRCSKKSAAHTGIDLLMADVPDNLPVPVVSDSSIPDWSKRSKNYFKILFTFAAANLHDDAVLLIIHPYDPTVTVELQKWAKTFDFELVRDWWGVNNLHLASSRDCLKTTLRFHIKVYSRIGSKFLVQENKTWLELGFSLERDGLLQNFTDEKNQLMRGVNVPWRGAREKHSQFMQIIIESLTKKGDIILDWQASTGSSIVACRESGRHIVAVEKDPDIFLGHLKSLEKASEASLPPPQGRLARVDLHKPPQKKHKSIDLRV